MGNSFIRKPSTSLSIRPAQVGATGHIAYITFASSTALTEETLALLADVSVDLIRLPQPQNSGS